MPTAAGARAHSVEYTVVLQNNALLQVTMQLSHLCVNMFDSLKSWGRRAVKRIGKFGGAAAKVVGRIGHFVAEHHQPLALALHTAAQVAPGPSGERLKDVAGWAMVASGAASSLGVGKDYFGAGAPGRPPPG